MQHTFRKHITPLHAIFHAFSNELLPFYETNPTRNRCEHTAYTTGQLSSDDIRNIEESKERHQGIPHPAATCS